ncbi:MAG TPA: hypothetical protein VN837_19245 [Chloroflexota bacterium]|nr:hypothetical protein [Chloroflexota bacterium]
MIGIVHSIDPSTVGTVIEANINAYLLSFAGLPGAVLHQDPRCVWLDAGIAGATFNSVVYARLSPEDMDAGIEAVLNHFRRRSLPFTWHIGPGTEPADLGSYLLTHGLTHSEDEPGMAVELDRARDDFAIPFGLVITPVRDEDDLREWVDVWLLRVGSAGRCQPFSWFIVQNQGAFFDMAGAHPASAVVPAIRPQPEAQYIAPQARLKEQ